MVSYVLASTSQEDAFSKKKKRGPFFIILLFKKKLWNKKNLDTVFFKLHEI